MVQSTLTDKGQTANPVQVRNAMNLKPQQKIEWELQPDGSAVVRSQPSALELFGSLKSKIRYSSIRKETEAAERAMAEEAVHEGLDR